LTKSICRLLLGFNFEEVPDAIQILKEKHAKQNAGSGQLSQIVQELFKETENEMEIEEDSESEEEEEEGMPVFKPYLLALKKEEIKKEAEKGILGSHQLLEGEQIGTIVLN